MSEVLDGRRITRALVRFNAMFGALVLLAAIVLFATGRWPGALGALLSTIPIGLVSLRFKRTVREARSKIARPRGTWIMAGVSALPGVIMIVVGYLIGDDFLIVVCTAAGASSIGMSGLLFAITRSLLPT
jgi:hypothetical protein